MAFYDKIIPKYIEIRGAHVHNLKNIDVDIPLNQIVGIAGVSGSGKSSLALGVLYAEGSRRYLESLSTYTRRRMTQAGRSDVDDVRYVPAALALHQRPGVPGIRSTFGTMTELLNSLRLMFSRLSSHRCPNGHYCPPSFDVALGDETVCPVCGAKFYGPGAEDLAFNSTGACPTCGGTGTVRTVDESTLIKDENLSIDDGAVAVWGTLMWSLMKDVCRLMGVRTDVPYKDLTPKEKEIVLHGPAVKKHMSYFEPNSHQQGEMDFTYFSAVHTVENALSKVKDEKGMKRVEKYLKEGVCPDCHGTRLSEAARAPRLRGISLADATAMTLSSLIGWVGGVPESLPEKMRPMAKNICESFLDTSKRLMDLGLGYLSLDRAASTLSTGERQRVQLARAVRNRTTGVLYVLDEPSIGLHPYNLRGLTGVMDDLIADGNSVVLVDHDTQVLSHSDYIIEMGRGAGASGGNVIGQGTVEEVEKDPSSVIGPYLSGKADGRIREKTAEAAPVSAAPPAVSAAAARVEADHPVLFRNGTIHLQTDRIHTVHPLDIRIPMGRLTVVTGVSGSGKTTLVLESLIPALKAITGAGVEDSGAGSSEMPATAAPDDTVRKVRLPAHIRFISAPGIRQVKLIDATPIGINIRSTVATYAGIHDELRKIYARSADARARKFKAGDFSYNTGKLRCPTCDGTGTISLDVQFLPDVEVTCPDCRGSRYGKDAWEVRHKFKSGKTYSLPQLMNMSVDEAIEAETGHPAADIAESAAGNADAAGCSAASVSDSAVPASSADSAKKKKATFLETHLQVLHDLGLGYLTLGEETPGLSGGEAQRLKLASEMGKGQKDSVFVFDEPTIGLHPQDVRTLLNVFQSLIDMGATVIVIEHDLDVIRNADYIIDMGPGGGEEGGRMVACGTPEEIHGCPESLTGRFLD